MLIEPNKLLTKLLLMKIQMLRLLENLKKKLKNLKVFFSFFFNSFFFSFLFFSLSINLVQLLSGLGLTPEQLLAFQTSSTGRIFPSSLL